MWIRNIPNLGENDKLLNLRNASFMEVCQWPNNNGDWCVIATFLMEHGNHLSASDIRQVVRRSSKPGSEGQGEMLAALEDIQLLLGREFIHTEVGGH